MFILFASENAMKFLKNEFDIDHRAAFQCSLSARAQLWRSVRGPAVSKTIKSTSVIKTQWCLRPKGLLYQDPPRPQLMTWRLTRFVVVNTKTWTVNGRIYAAYFATVPSWTTPLTGSLAVTRCLKIGETLFVFWLSFCFASARAFGRAGLFWSSKWLVKTKGSSSYQSADFYTISI